jgi:hypothetical protein
VNSISEDGQRPQTATDFFNSLFRYLDALKKGEVIGYLGQKISLNPSEVVYYVGVMEPITPKQPLSINPAKSLYSTYAESFNYAPDDFRTDDYMVQYGEREQEQLQAAIAAERRAAEEAARRTLREQQDREYAAAEAADLAKRREREQQANESTHGSHAAEKQPLANAITTSAATPGATGPLPLTPEELREAWLKAFGG